MKPMCWTKDIILFFALFIFCSPIAQAAESMSEEMAVENVEVTASDEQLTASIEQAPEEQASVEQTSEEQTSPVVAVENTPKIEEEVVFSGATIPPPIIEHTSVTSHATQPKSESSKFIIKLY